MSGVSRKISSELADQIVADYAAGLTMAAVADARDVSVATVHKTVTRRAARVTVTALDITREALAKRIREEFKASDLKVTVK